MLKKIIFTLSVLILAASANATDKGQNSFVKVKGSHFEINGKPYYYMGANFWYGAYMGTQANYGDRKRLQRELDYLLSIGVDNLRVLAASEFSENSATISPYTQTKPGVYNEELLDGLDFLLAEMGKRNMKAILFLNNYWDWSGGMRTYLNWFGQYMSDDTVKNKSNWQRENDFVQKFYINEKAQATYLNYVKMLINRKNSYTGKLYKDDTAIMTWELSNEPRPGNDEQGVKFMPVFCKWIDQTAGFIKMQDPNHLVTTGSEGSWGTLFSGEYFIQAHQSKNIDYAVFHLWPMNWSWFAPKKGNETIGATISKSTQYINDHISYARKLNKPIVFEEFGLDRDNAVRQAGSPVTARDSFYKATLYLMCDSAAKGAPIVGANIWSWAGEGRSPRPDYVWKPGDPFTGDPPQEAQGLNSVFDNDKSTIAIIQNVAKRMKAVK